MIPPRKQWCVQIEVTNACPRACSNCTRMTAHVREPFFMIPAEFQMACEAVAEFPLNGEPNMEAGDPPGHKLVGMMGGEPQIHPDFDKLCEIMRRAIPRREHRGLWTSANYGMLATVFGYINHNPHDTRPSVHQPVLVGIQEVIRDDARMWAIIEGCPLQRQWASAITPKGFFFCEVAASLDTIFQGPGGMPVTAGCWQHDLADYRDQIERWCPRCGVCLPLAGRLDCEGRDDISPANLEALRSLGSPRVLKSEYVPFDAASYTPPADWRPLKYLRDR